MLKPVLEFGLNKSAVVVSKDLFSQIAIEQIADGTKGSAMVTKYFDNKEAARKWLLSV
jgi:hypothetical protein